MSNLKAWHSGFFFKHLVSETKLIRERDLVQGLPISQPWVKMAAAEKTLPEQSEELRVSGVQGATSGHTGRWGDDIWGGRPTFVQLSHTTSRTDSDEMKW